MIEERKRVTTLSLSPIHRDARVQRQAIYLAKEYTVTVIGYGELGVEIENVHFLPIPSPNRTIMRGLKIGYLPAGRIFGGTAYEGLFWRESEHRAALELLIQSNTELIHANDWDTLPIAVRAAEKTGAKILLDLHEYSPLLRDNRRYWKLFYAPMIDYFLRKYASLASASITVNETIAEKYAQEYGFKPGVVMNVPALNSRSVFKPTDPESIHLVHHGAAIRDRELDRMVRVAAGTDPRYKLHFMLVDRDPGYIDELQELARSIAPDRVFFDPPVAPAEIVNRISAYDIGLYILPPLNFNYSAASPNKFFDFVAAGLAVCIGPSPEMSRLVGQFDFGVVARSFEAQDASELLNDLNPEDIDRMKQNALKASDRLNADVEMDKLLKIYAQLLETRSSTQQAL